MHTVFYHGIPGPCHRRKNSSLTWRRAMGCKKETSGVEKKNGRRVMSSVSTEHHTTSRTISGSLTLPTVLSRWSFISRRHQESGRKRKGDDESWGETLKARIFWRFTSKSPLRSKYPFAVYHSHIYRQWSCNLRSVNALELDTNLF